MVVGASPLIFWKRPFAISEQVLSVHERPFASYTEAVLHNGAGIYAKGARLEHAGTVPVVCQTSSGILEFCVTRNDLRLFLHYIEILRKRRGNHIER
jgi:hypothetical protein